MRGAYFCRSTNTPRDNLTRSISSFPQISLACLPSRCSITRWELQIGWQMRMSDSKTFYRLNTKTEHHSPYSTGWPNLISISFCIRLIRSGCTIIVLYILLKFPYFSGFMYEYLLLSYHVPLTACFVSHAPSYSRCRSTRSGSASLIAVEIEFHGQLQTAYLYFCSSYSQFTKYAPSCKALPRPMNIQVQGDSKLKI